MGCQSFNVSRYIYAAYSKYWSQWLCTGFNKSSELADFLPLLLLPVSSSSTLPGGVDHLAAVQGMVTDRYSGIFAKFKKSKVDGRVSAVQVLGVRPGDFPSFNIHLLQTRTSLQEEHRGIDLSWESGHYAGCQAVRRREAATLKVSISGCSQKNNCKGSQSERRLVVPPPTSSPVFLGTLAAFRLMKSFQSWQKWQPQEEKSMFLHWIKD